MLIRYVLVFLLVHIVHGRHVLNKVPVRVEKPVRLFKGSSSSQNKINDVIQKVEENTNADDGNAELVPSNNKDKKEGDEDKELLIPANQDDNGEADPSNKDDRKSDEENKLLIAENDNEQKPERQGEDDKDENGEEKELLIPGGEKGDNEGEKELSNPGGDKDENGEEKELTPIIALKDEGEEVTPANGKKVFTFENGEQREISPMCCDNKTNSRPDNKNQLNSNYNDDLLERYHPEKVGYMEDDISASWPLGIIPYHFDASSFDDILASRVRDAMDLLEHSSCLQFRALAGRGPGNHTWIHITNPWRQRECSHKPKRKSSGEIVLVLGLDCLKQRDILHSLLHAIGFNDEVTHPYRDQYIRIMWENIQPAYHQLFSIIPRHKKLLVEYDPMSIMHFHDRAFSKNGQATISIMMPGLQIQPSDKLSQLDKMRLRLAFGHECNRRTVDKIFDTCKTVLRTHQNENEQLTLKKLRPRRPRPNPPNLR